MHHGIVGLHGSILLRNIYGNLRRYCAISVKRSAARDASRDSRSTLVNNIVQLPVSNIIAELPGLDREVQAVVAVVVASSTTKSSGSLWCRENRVDGHQSILC